MKREIKNVVVALFAVLVVATAISAQDETFSRNGISFNYPKGWFIHDESNKNSDELTFVNAELDVQLKVTLFKTLLSKPDQLAEAKKILVDRYIDSITKNFADAGGKPVSTPSTSEIGGTRSEGVQIAATLEGSPGTAEVEWAVIDERMVVLTLLGPTSDVRKAAAAWDTIRTTVKVEPRPAEPVKKP